MKYDVLKKDNSLIFKIISFILVLGYTVFFIIQFITTNFVNIANQDGLIWKVVTGENNGYPILIKTDE